MATSKFGLMCCGPEGASVSLIPTVPVDVDTKEISVGSILFLLFMADRESFI
jgi:hypothetical protein